MRPTHQDLSNDTTFSQIKSRVHVPLKGKPNEISDKNKLEILVRLSLYKVDMRHLGNCGLIAVWSLVHEIEHLPTLHEGRYALRDSVGIDIFTTISFVPLNDKL